jgi:hypothetical protein
MSAGKTALSAVQAAVMAVLAEDQALMAIVAGGVWDYVPADNAWPFVCLDSADEVPDDTYGRQGRKVHLTFSIFSQFQGRSEQFLILDAMVRLLRHVKLSPVGSPPILAGWDHLQTWHTGSQAISPFEVGNTRAGGSSVSFEVVVIEKKTP